MEFNFKKVKKEPLRMVLPDGTALTLLPPKYKQLKKISAMEGSLNDEQAIALVADLLSDNLEKIQISAKQITEQIDISDLSAFVETYMKYLQKITSQKN